METGMGVSYQLIVGSHWALGVTLGVLGGELLPAAPLQPCAGAPSGRGHLDILDWILRQDITPGRCLPCSTGMRHPLGMAPCAEAPHPLCGRWVLSPSEPCQYIPCPILPINNYCLLCLLRAFTLIALLQCKVPRTFCSSSIPQ